MVQSKRMLPYRVLDLCDGKGIFCGRILGDLGCDVIKVEKPGGDPSLILGPFDHDSLDSEKSLFWLAYNANKRSITLAIEKPEGKEIFKMLVQKADVVLESFPPGTMAGLGLGYEELSKVNPSLVMTSITPFGQSGPYRDFKASDLTLWCLGGMAYVSGDPDRAPVQVSSPQSYLHGAAAAAAATLIALYDRELTGETQWIDVSIQEAVVHTLMNVVQFWDVSGIVLKRSGAFRTGLSTAANQRLIWRCKDGYVNFPIYATAGGAQSNAKLVRWMESEGIRDEHLSSIQWEEFDLSTASQEQFDLVEGSIGRFFNSHTMDELYQGAIERGIMLYPVYGAKEIREDPQLKARGFWSHVDHPKLGEVTFFPGSPFVFSGERQDIRRAPLIGEHNEDIYRGELGISGEEFVTLEEAGII
jgi:crotonobetainyl-CoA:carnitine CoA-transferase CaiB-like acyl-CoA transferase